MYFGKTLPCNTILSTSTFTSSKLVDFSQTNSYIFNKHSHLITKFITFFCNSCISPPVHEGDVYQLYTFPGRGLIPGRTVCPHAGTDSCPILLASLGVLQKIEYYKNIKSSTSNKMLLTVIVIAECKLLGQI